MGAFDNIQVFHEVANQAIKKYDFPSMTEIKFLTLSENATYLIYNTKTKEKIGFLRVGRPDYHTHEEYDAEVAWLYEINNYTPLQVANPLYARDGSYIQDIKGSDGDMYYTMITEALAGEPLDEEDTEHIVNQYEMLGEITAYLHKQTQMWNKTSTLDRWDWDYDNIIGKTAKWGHWQDYEGFSDADKEILTQCDEIIQKRLLRYGKNDENWGLIHADLRQSNVLVDADKKIKVIDFDDAGFGWYLQDLAASISFIEHKDIAPDLINGWLRGYKKVMPFSDESFAEIDTFIMLRRLQMSAWLETHSDSDPAKGFKIGWVDGTMMLAKRYLRIFG
ncbi:phosphotransferase [Ligilactobacillus sp. WILCCON 0076]|uniref:Phosphotransferase n=1 Tax=Ligilactobacillus ubinensis TaxID=2876789 RepID=A0A9X2FMH7_9LACO|nr:phosphotransferase [Ligilactobacillus ubinensis]MCP0887829.1 phosphotransferase [Ligilactobacillus ubinensis]